MLRKTLERPWLGYGTTSTSALHLGKINNILKITLLLPLMINR